MKPYLYSFRTLIYLFVITHSTLSFNILGIFPHHGKSHFLVFRVYLRELVSRGHNVTVISHFPEKDPPVNYHDISLAGSMKLLSNEIPMERSYWTILGLVSFIISSGRENCKVMVGNEKVRDLLKQEPKFDVVVVEQFNSDCALGIAHKLGAPVVATISSVSLPWHYNRHGIPYNPSYVPSVLFDGGFKPTLYQRLERFVFDSYFKALYSLSQRSDQKTLAAYYDDIPPLEDLAREIKILLLNQNFILTGSRLVPANVIEIGGYHLDKEKPLSGDLKKFVEDAEHGVVYISFGTLLKSSTIHKEKLKAVLEAMNEFPQRFIWKWEDTTLLTDQNKLYVDNWLPQIDILAHTKTVAFFSHAGMGGTTEAIHFGVPMIAMPILGDQPSNAAAIEESGLGVQLQYSDLTKERLVATLKKVLEPSFREKAKQLSKAWHDRPLSPLDTAIYWTEFAARHSNFTFRTAAADVPAYQYFNLDILFTLVLIFFIIFVVIRKIFSESKDNQKISKRE